MRKGVQLGSYAPLRPIGIGANNLSATGLWRKSESRVHGPACFLTGFLMSRKA